MKVDEAEEAGGLFGEILASGVVAVAVMGAGATCITESVATGLLVVLPVVGAWPVSLSRKARTTKPKRFEAG